MGKVLGLNGGLAEVDTRGRTITLTVCEAAHGKLTSWLKTPGLKVTLGGNKGALAANGGRNGLHGLNDVWFSGGKIAGDGWNMAGGMMSLFSGLIFVVGWTGAGLFLISCLRHLARRFWNQT